MSKNPVLSGSGFASTSMSKPRPVRKRQTGISKHMGSTKLTVLLSLFLLSVNGFISSKVVLDRNSPIAKNAEISRTTEQAGINNSCLFRIDNNVLKK